MIILSIVSHGQLSIIKDFLGDFSRQVLPDVKIILTINIPEDESVLDNFKDLPISLIRNIAPKGFGENHNFAFLQEKSSIFAIVNPDVRINDFSLDAMLSVLMQDRVGACAPVVVDSLGEVQDSVRKYPTILSLAKRIISGRREPDYSWQEKPIEVDWSAGMFILFRSEAYMQVKGFDERYFMYYEDADIGRRLARKGWKTMLEPNTTVIHDAQRASHRSIRHLQWHLKSMFRFLFFP